MNKNISSFFSFEIVDKKNAPRFNGTLFYLSSPKRSAFNLKNENVTLNAAKNLHVNVANSPPHRKTRALSFQDVFWRFRTVF